jgi:hypothetical protein
MSELGLIKRVYKSLQKNLFKQRIEMIFFSNWKVGSAIANAKFVQMLLLKLLDTIIP